MALSQQWTEPGQTTTTTLTPPSVISRQHVSMLCYFVNYNLLSPPVSHHSVWSVIGAHNFTPLKRDYWFCVCISHVCPGRTLRRSRSWNKYVSTQPTVYYTSLHSQNTLQTVLKLVHNPPFAYFLHLRHRRTQLILLMGATALNLW